MLFPSTFPDIKPVRPQKLFSQRRQSSGKKELPMVQMVLMVRDNSQSAQAFMELALEQAQFALDNLEVPVGCVIVEDGKVIASGSNWTNETRNATRHAEMEAIDTLLEQWQRSSLSQLEVAEKFSKCDLYVTCEPCIMCATALSILGIKAVYYGCANDKFGGCGSILALHSIESEQFSSGKAIQGKGFKCAGGIMSSEAVSLLRSFYEQGNPNVSSPENGYHWKGITETSPTVLPWA